MLKSQFIISLLYKKKNMIVKTRLQISKQHTDLNRYVIREFKHNEKDIMLANLNRQNKGQNKDSKCVYVFRRNRNFLRSD